MESPTIVRDRDECFVEFMRIAHSSLKPWVPKPMPAFKNVEFGCYRNDTSDV